MSVGAIEAGRAFVRLMVNDTALTKGLKSAQAKVKMFAAATGSLGRQLLGVSAALGAPLIAGTKVYADFEKQMAQVSTMLDDPSQFMSGFAEGIKTLSVEFGEATDTLAGGLYEILSASVAPAQAMDVLTTAVKAAKAGLSDTATATKAIVTIMNAYQMSAGQAGEISDWMFQVVKRGQSTFEELAPNIGNVATIAATAGVSLNELGAIFSTITRNGVQTEEAITAINSIISAFLDPADEAEQIARDLGINMSVSALQSEGLLAVFQKLGGLPPDVLAKLFPNIRALKGVLPALRNLDGFAEDMAALGKSAGSTDIAYQKLASSMSMQFDRTKQAVLLAANEIGEALSGMVSDGATSITHIAKATADWIKRNQQLVQGLGKVAVMFAAVAGALLAMSAAMTLLLAHPIVALLAALSVSVTFLVSDMAELKSQMEGIPGAMDSVRKKGDEMRASHLALWKELETLAEKEQLSNEEFARAESIIGTLEGRYGDLGLSMDKAAGVMGDMAEAQAALSEQMRRATIGQLSAEIANHELALRKLERQREGWAHQTGVGFGLVDEESLAGAIKAERAALDVLKARLGSLNSGATGDDLISGTGGDTAESTSAAAVESANAIVKSKEQAEFSKRMAERLHEAKMAMIDQEEKREKEAIKGKHDLEIAEAERTGQDIAALKGAQAAEIAAVDHKYAKERADRERDIADEIARIGLETKYDGMDEQLQLLAFQEQIEKREAIKRGDSTESIARKYDALREQARRDHAKRMEGTQDEIAELEIQAKSTGMKEQLALLEEQRRRAIRDAKLAGDPVDMVNRRFDLLSKLAKQEAYAKVPEVTGTFSAQMAARMGGTGNIEKEQLKAQKEISVATQKTARVLEAGFSLI